MDWVISVKSVSGLILIWLIDYPQKFKLISLLEAKGDNKTKFITQNLWCHDGAICGRFSFTPTSKSFICFTEIPIERTSKLSFKSSQRALRFNLTLYDGWMKFNIFDFCDFFPINFDIKNYIWFFIFFH